MSDKQTPKTFDQWLPVSGYGEKQFLRHKEYIIPLMNSWDAAIESRDAEIDELKEEIKRSDENLKWLAACLRNFHPFKEQPDSGLCPTFYQTLAHRGDLELFKKFKEIESILNGDKDG